MLPEDYNVREDDSFIEFVDEKNFPKSSREKYRNALMNYTNFTEQTLDELIDEAEQEEEDNIRLSRRKIRKKTNQIQKKPIR